MTGDGRSLTGNWDHSVVITGYDPITQKITYSDNQLKASGTFDWGELQEVRGGR